MSEAPMQTLVVNLDELRALPHGTLVVGQRHHSTEVGVVAQDTRTHAVRWAGSDWDSNLRPGWEDDGHTITYPLTVIGRVEDYR